jgi:WGR domain
VKGAEDGFLSHQVSFLLLSKKTKLEGLHSSVLILHLCSSYPCILNSYCTTTLDTARHRNSSRLFAVRVANSLPIPVKEARNHGHIRVVSLEWLLDSIDSKARAAEDSYLMTPPPTLDEDAKGKKRVKAKEPENESPTPDKDVKGKKAKEQDNEPPALDKDTKSKKRVKDDEADNEPPKKRFKDGQKLKNLNLTIPLDEGCNLGSAYCVYVNPEGVIFDVSLNQTNAGNNNNKFYRIQVSGRLCATPKSPGCAFSLLFPCINNRPQTNGSLAFEIILRKLQDMDSLGKDR